MFQHFEQFAGDPILGINAKFLADPRKQKINLSIGVYLDERGNVPLLPTVREAQRRILEEGKPRPYLPIEGLEKYRKATAELLFGPDSAAIKYERVVTVQTIGSSGALKICAELVRRWFPDTTAWVSTPTWDNHRAILEGAGVPVRAYPYYDGHQRALDFAGMMAAVTSMPAGSLVVIHGCCHNPTGVDLSEAQWKTLVPVLQERKLLPIVDLAYQGFGDGLEIDAFPLRLMDASGLSFIVVNSFSKNMSIYGERAGALSVVTQSREEAALVFGQLQATIRRNWSNPPTHAGEIASYLMTDPLLKIKWIEEVDLMRRRIKSMRVALHSELSRLMPANHFDYVLEQRGMFSYTGLSATQVSRMQINQGVYLVPSGRICVAALNDANVRYAAEAISAVMS